MAETKPSDTAMLPAPDLLPTTSLPGLTDAPAVADPAPVLPAASPIDDITGGDDRGGITAMREPAPVPAPAVPAVNTAVSSGELESLKERIASIEAKVSDLIAKIDGNPSRLQATPSESAPAVASELTTGEDLASLEPPLKPEIIDSATLKGVSRDVAWVSTGSGVVEVKAGDTIPNAGRVLKIREYQGNWIVVTTDGIVVQ